jgi:hypothetical protein
LIISRIRVNNSMNCSESTQIVITILLRLIRISCLKNSPVSLKVLSTRISKAILFNKLRKWVAIKFNLLIILNFSNKSTKRKIINDCLISSIRNIRSLKVILYLLFLLLILKLFLYYIKFYIYIYIISIIKIILIFYNKLF